MQEDPPNFVGTDTWSQYDGDEIYSDYTIDGQDVTVTTWYEPGIGKVEDVSGTPVVKYYHDNLIGTTRFMTDASGDKIEAAVYTAFGELVSGDPRRFGYAGAYGYQGEQAGEMPFLHVGHRYYDPSTGRFLEGDPIGIDGGLNVYLYAGAIPTLLVDALGLQTKCPCGGIKGRDKRQTVKGMRGLKGGQMGCGLSTFFNKRGLHLEDCPNHPDYVPPVPIPYRPLVPNSPVPPPANPLDDFVGPPAPPRPMR